MQRFRQFLLTENRLEHVQKKYANLNSSHDIATGGWDLNSPHEIINHIHYQLGGPDEHEKHLDWAVGQYHHGNYKLEDTSRVYQNLSDFEDIKHKLPSNERDIKQYSLNPEREQTVDWQRRQKKHDDDPSVPYANILDRVPRRKLKKNLHDTIRQHTGTGHDPNFPDGPRFEGHPGAEKIHDDGKGNTVHTLWTHEAAKAARQSCGFTPNGDGGWCVGWKNPDHFNHYTHDDQPSGHAHAVPTRRLHLLQTADNKKSLLHFDSHQHMDKDDNAVDTAAYVEKHPEFKNVKVFNQMGHVHNETNRHFMKPETVHDHVEQHIKYTTQSSHLDIPMIAHVGTIDQLDRAINKHKALGGERMSMGSKRAVAQRGHKPHLDELMKDPEIHKSSPYIVKDILAHWHLDHAKAVDSQPFGIGDRENRLKAWRIIDSHNNAVIDSHEKNKQ